MDEEGSNDVGDDGTMSLEPKKKPPDKRKFGGKTFHRAHDEGFGSITEANKFAQKRVSEGKEVKIVHRVSGKMGYPSQTKPYFVYERDAWWKRK